MIMQNRFNMPRGLATKTACWMVLILGAASLSAQSARNLTRVKKVFVPSFSEGNGAAELYQSLVKQLRKSGTFEVVADSSQADAVIKATGADLD